MRVFISLIPKNALSTLELVIGKDWTALNTWSNNVNLIPKLSSFSILVHTSRILFLFLIYHNKFLLVNALISETQSWILPFSIILKWELNLRILSENLPKLKKEWPKSRELIISSANGKYTGIKSRILTKKGLNKLQNWFCCSTVMSNYFLLHICLFFCFILLL